MIYYSTDFIPVVEQLLREWVFELEQSPAHASQYETNEDYQQRLQDYWQSYRNWQNHSLNEQQKSWLHNIETDLNKLSVLLESQSLKVNI